MPSEDHRNLLISRVRTLLDELEAAQPEGAAREHLSWPHPKAQSIIEARGHTKEQMSFLSPVQLDLRRRLQRYNLDHGKPGVQNIIVGVLDAALRQEGYPPESS